MLGPRAAADRLERLERAHTAEVTLLNAARRMIGTLVSGRQPTWDTLQDAEAWLRDSAATMSETRVP